MANSKSALKIIVILLVLGVVGFIIYEFIYPIMTGAGEVPEGIDPAEVGEAIENVIDDEDAVNGEAAPPEEDEAAYRTFQLDGANTFIAWTGYKINGAMSGGFYELEGAVRLPDMNLEKAQVKLDVDLSSVQSSNSILTGVLKGESFFHVEQHPTATFESTSIEQTGDNEYKVTGNLTMKGTTKSLSFPATVEVSEDSVTVMSEFTMDRKAWNIGFDEWNGIGIKREVKVNIEAELEASDEAGESVDSAA